MRAFSSLYLGILLVFWITSAGATAATNIELKYSLDTKTLHVEADHQTDRVNRKFIRKVSIFLNGSTESSDFYFTRQKLPVRFEEDFAVAAKPGDRMEVQLYSSEGGLATETLTIAQPTEKK